MLEEIKLQCQEWVLRESMDEVLGRMELSCILIVMAARQRVLIVIELTHQKANYMLI